MTGQPHDRPTIDELLHAVEEFLQDESASASDRGRRFNLRLAANAVAIVRRQLAVGATQEVAHAARLARLEMGDDAQLAAAIRGGALDDRYDEVLEIVREAVLDKLAVANPRYAEATVDERGDG